MTSAAVCGVSGRRLFLLTSRFFQSEHQFRTLTNFRKSPIIFEDLWCLTAGPPSSSPSGKTPENPYCNQGGYEHSRNRPCGNQSFQGLFPTVNEAEGPAVKHHKSSNIIGDFLKLVRVRNWCSD